MMVDSPEDRLSENGLSVGNILLFDHLEEKMSYYIQLNDNFPANRAKRNSTTISVPKYEKIHRQGLAPKRIPPPWSAKITFQPSIHSKKRFSPESNPAPPSASNGPSLSQNSQYIRTSRKYPLLFLYIVIH